MAQLRNVINGGFLKLPTTANTSSGGNIWFDSSDQRVKYSYLSGGSILSKNLGE